MAKGRSHAKTSAKKTDRETLLWTGVLVALVVALLGYNVYRWSKAIPPEAEDLKTFEVKVGEVQEYLPMEDSSHLGDDGGNPQYNSDPPTSGPHYDDPAQPGFYAAPLPAEVLVANLEEGDVVIYYSPKLLSEENQEQLKALVEQHKEQPHQLVAVPRDDPEFALIATGWTRVLRLKRFDLVKTRTFISRYLGEGPGHGG